MKRAARRAGSVAFCSEESGNPVGVLKISEPVAAGVVCSVNDTVEHHPTHAVGLHGGEGLAEKCAVGKAPILELFFAPAICSAGKDGGRILSAAAMVGEERFGAFRPPFAMAFDDFDHVADDVRGAHVPGYMLLSIPLVKASCFIAVRTYLAEGTRSGKDVGEDFRVL